MTTAEIMGYGVIAIALIFLAIAFYAQSALSGLMDFVRERPDAMPRLGRISDLYFLYELPRCHYGFVWFLFKNKTPPAKIAQAFPDYSRLRTIANLAFGWHVLLGVAIVVLIVAHQVL